LDFLESFDFNHIKVDILISESSDEKEKNTAVEDYMQLRGYRPFRCIIPRSLLFIHESVNYCYGLLKNRTSLRKVMEFDHIFEMDCS